jgi:hypothetical protein
MLGVLPGWASACAAGGDKGQHDDGTRAEPKALIPHPATERAQRAAAPSGSLLLIVGGGGPRSEAA